MNRGFREVIHDLSFDFAGGVLGIMGPNGAGKSTFLRVIGEGARLRSGTVMVDGIPLGSSAGLHAIRERVGYQAQRPAFVPHFTVGDNLRYAAWLKGKGGRDGESRVLDIAASVNLLSVAGQRAGRLSGGQAKRLAIGMALVHDPSLVVLDEPTAALDPDEHASMLDVLRLLAERASVVFTSHDPGDIGAVCDDVLVIAQGVARFHGAVDELTASGTRSVVEGYREAVGQ